MKIEKISKEISILRRSQTAKSIQLFVKTYLAHHFKYPLSQAHLAICVKLLDIMCNRGRKIAVGAARSFGKSAVISFAYVLYVLCYSKEHFIVIISETTSQVEQLLENVKRELVENELLRQDFPEIFEYHGIPKPPRWTQRQIETRNGIKVLALGAQQPITGRKYGKYRPSLIVLDDVESAKNNYSLEAAENVNCWFTKSILKAGDESTNYIFVGTIHHPFSFFATHVKPPVWERMIYKAIISEPKHPELWAKCFNIKYGRDNFEGKVGIDAARAYYSAIKAVMDEGIEILWPSRWTNFDLMNMRDDDPISFSAEFQNEPFDLLTAIFRLDLAQYWNKQHVSLEDLLHYLGDHADFYLGCDPCTGQDLNRGDYSAIIVIARDRRDGCLYVIAADIERRDLNKTIENILTYARRFTFTKVGVEANGFQVIALRQLEQEARKRGIYLPLEAIKNTGDKYKRIQSVEPLIRIGSLKLNENHKLLLEQLQFFPRAKHDDGPDALEMCVRLAEEIGEIKIY
ncbi:MAG: phage terminase large subunit [Candidatus Omnitrophota bacterium]|jgi:phage terminase large subunit-like protein